jgi:glycosyltransferase involved in cell wall biosynthesis
VKIGIYLMTEINPSVGGSFSYYDKLIRAIDNHSFEKKIEVCFIGRIPAIDIKTKKTYHQLSSNKLYRFFLLLQKTGIVKLFSRIFSTNADWCNRKDISILKKNNIDIILFPKQFLKEVDNFPFITMNWDSGHKSTFLFPEFYESFTFRENWYRFEIQKALAIIVESESGKREFVDFFGIPQNKIFIVPLFPGGVVDMVVSAEEQEKTLQEFSLKPRQYFYYPAQFWAHKNHYNLIHAFAALITRENDDVKLVFTGSDKGNKEYIISVIRELKLENRVLVMNFVSNEAVYTLYKHSRALVMPTFLGPTNMPLLEAQCLGTAVICSDFDGHREICGDGAIYVDPADPDQLCNAMQKVSDDAVRNDLILKSNKVLNLSGFTLKRAIMLLEEGLIKLHPIRKTFL